MSHTTGRIVARNRRVGPDSGTPATAPNLWEWVTPIDPALQGGGPPRFVMLHFTGATLPAGASVEVNVGYGLDRWDATSGGSFWSRPIDPKAAPVTVRFKGASGGVTVAEYASSEPVTTGIPGAPYGSTTNCDAFLHTNPYQEPVYETRLSCNGVFDWDNAAPAATTAAEKAAVAATGMIVAVHRHGGHFVLSTCTGTLIGPDQFLTARHCLTEGDGADIASASVTFDFETGSGGARPAGYSPRWHKVTRVVRAGAPPNGYDITTDWMILQLDTGSSGIGVVPAKLRSTMPSAGSTAIAVHHPHGASKKLQRRVLQTGDVNVVHDFDFAGGSSGSALFDSSGQVIGATLSSGPIGGNACRAGYVASTSVLAQLAAPPDPPTPFDIMLVIDRSGSMSAPGSSGAGRTKMVEARDAAAEFVRLVRSLAGHRIGVVSFSTTAALNHALAAVDPASTQQLVGLAPYTSGVIGGITPTALTSIGAGISEAMAAMPPSGNQRAILLLTDGLENTVPWLDQVEPLLQDTAVFAVGYGTDADVDGPRLTRLAREHRGIFLRANSGLALRKYFGLCFGNIFQAGLLKDPEFELPAGANEDEPMTFDVCDETEITAIVGWEQPFQDLVVELVAPDGTQFDASSGHSNDRGLTWTYLRIPLPANGNREGTWAVRIRRHRRHEGKGAVRYFVAVTADGGPVLRPMPPEHLVRPGSPLPIKVGLHYPDGSVPPNAEVQVTVTTPGGSLIDLVARHGRVAGGGGPDPVSDWTATLQAIAAASGGELPLPTFDKVFDLYDDGAHDDGAMEPDGIFSVTPPVFTAYEGTYTFHARARYGLDCHATREAMWAVTVGLDDNPYHTEVEPG